jgi:crossover junction endodeoxyribonuclease RuvC
MRVEVRLYGPLKSYLPDGAVGQRADLELHDGATVGDLLSMLGMSDIRCIVAVNDELAERSRRLNDNDVVSIFPPIAGGALRGAKLVRHKRMGKTNDKGQKRMLSHSTVKVIGIDPGLRTTGYAVIEADGKLVRLLETGVITSSSRKPLPERLRELFNDVKEMIKELKPDVVVLEKLFCKWGRSTLMLGHARGAVITAVAELGTPIVEYTFTQVKHTLLGNGKASKEKLHTASKAMIGISFVEEPAHEHAMDALSLALCYVLSNRLSAHHDTHRKDEEL